MNSSKEGDEKEDAVGPSSKEPSAISQPRQLQQNEKPFIEQGIQLNQWGLEEEKMEEEDEPPQAVKDAAAAVDGPALRLSREEAARLQQMQPKCFSLVDFIEKGEKCSGRCKKTIVARVFCEDSNKVGGKVHTLCTSCLAERYRDGKLLFESEEASSIECPMIRCTHRILICELEAAMRDTETVLSEHLESMRKTRLQQQNAGGAGGANERDSSASSTPLLDRRLSQEDGENQTGPLSNVSPTESIPPMDLEEDQPPIVAPSPDDGEVECIVLDDDPVDSDPNDDEVQILEDGPGRKTLSKEQRPRATPMPAPVMSAIVANQILGSMHNHLARGEAHRVISALEWKMTTEQKNYFDDVSHRRVIFNMIGRFPPSSTLLDALTQVIKWDETNSNRPLRILQSRLQEEKLHKNVSLSFATLPTYVESNGVVEKRTTPLATAVEMGNVQWAEFFIKNGASINDWVKHAFFKGPLISYAITMTADLLTSGGNTRPSFKLIRILLAYGANRESARICLKLLRTTTIREQEGINEHNFYEHFPYYSDLYSIIMESCSSIAQSFHNQLRFPEFGDFVAGSIDETVCTVPYEKTLELEFAAHYDAAKIPNNSGPLYPPVFAVVAGIAPETVAERNEQPMNYRDSAAQIILQHSPGEPLFTVFPCGIRKQGSAADPRINSIPLVPLRDGLSVFIIPRRLYSHIKSLVIHINEERVGVDKIVYGGLFRLSDGKLDEVQVWMNAYNMRGARGEQYDGCIGGLNERGRVPS